MQLEVFRIYDMERGGEVLSPYSHPPERTFHPSLSSFSFLNTKIAIARKIARRLDRWQNRKNYNSRKLLKGLKVIVPW